MFLVPGDVHIHPAFGKGICLLILEEKFAIWLQILCFKLTVSLNSSCACQMEKGMWFV